MKFIKQIIRGCGELPHMGTHPGTTILLVFVLLGGLAGREGGIRGMIGGAAIMLIVFGPMYLYGAYSRAKESDAMSKKEF